MSVQTIIAPSCEPVFLQDVKDFLRIDSGDTSNDATLTTMIDAARNWTEDFCKRRWMFQTLCLSEDFFPGTFDQRYNTLAYAQAALSGASAVFAGVRFAFVLPYSPVVEVLNIQYVSSSDSNTGDLTYTTYPANAYIVDSSSNPARVVPIFGTFWPIAAVIQNAVLLNYTAGYGRAVTGVGIATDSQLITGAAFAITDVGSTISISGAGPNGSSLNGLIVSVDAETFAATVSIPASTTVSNASAVVGVPSQVKLAITALAALWYENRLGMDSQTPDYIKCMLFPYRDLRLK